MEALEQSRPEHADILLALRAELANELGLGTDAVGRVDAAVAALILEHLGELARKLGRRPPTGQPEHVLADSHQPGRRDILTRTLRDLLAEELSVEPARLGQLSPAAAAHTLLLLYDRKRRLATVQSQNGVEEELPPERDRRDVLGRVMRESLAEQLGVAPSLLRGLAMDQAAALLVRVIGLRHRMAQLERQLQPGQVGDSSEDRRDVVGRAVRTLLADQLEIHPRALSGLTPVGGARVLSHISSARTIVARMQNQVAVDELTGALRRAAGEARLEQEIRRARRMVGGGLVIAFIDVDSLKALNDSEGHAAGDLLLQHLVGTLRARLRSYDAIIRWGGDEFIAVLPQTPLDASEKVMAAVVETFVSQTRRRFTAGFAELREEDTLADLVARADNDLYRRKGHGGTPAPPPRAPAPAEPAPPEPRLGRRIVDFLLGR